MIEPGRARVVSVPRAGLIPPPGPLLSGRSRFPSETDLLHAREEAVVDAARRENARAKAERADRLRRGTRSSIL